MPKGKPGRKPAAKHTAPTSAQTTTTPTGNTEPIAAARTGNSRIPAPRTIPPGPMLDELQRLQGIVSERQRLLDIADSAYAHQIGRMCEHYKLDSNFDWQYFGGNLVPIERRLSTGMTMAAGG